MLLFSLFQNSIGLIIPWLFALVIAITIHEFSHGAIAYALGDHTAERAGRLTLNPLAHLDPLGAIMLLIFGFGWARPVPINPYQIGKGRLGLVMVSVAGIAANILLAVLAASILKAILLYTGVSQLSYLVKFLAFLVYINIGLGVFNLLPVPPLDGFRIFESFAPIGFRRYGPLLERWGFVLLVALVFLTNIVSIVVSFAVMALSLAFHMNIFGLAGF